MVLALLAGRKTQTRRLAWRDPIPVPADAADYWRGRGARVSFPDDTDTCIAWLRSPWQKVRPGDRLWVREAWGTIDLGAPHRIEDILFRADPGNDEWNGRWSPSIHMPRWASRLTLTVTDVRVQRLQEISEADADAECFGGDFPHRVLPHLFPDADKAGHLSLRECFAALWNSLHGPDAWAANPEVVALTFTVEQRNIDA